MRHCSIDFMGWRAGILIVALAFLVLFSLIAIAPIANSRPAHQDMRPNKPLISPLDVLEIALREAKKQDANTTDIALYFPFYNFSKSQSLTPFEQVYRGYYNVSLVQHIRKNPEGLHLSMYYFHPNGTQYAVKNTDDFALLPREVTTSYCKPSANESRCQFVSYQLYGDRFVYLIDAAMMPRGSAIVLVIDAESGDVLVDNVPKPYPRGVTIYDNVSNAKTIKEIDNEKLHPIKAIDVSIEDGSHIQASGQGFEPKNVIGSMTLSNRIVWANKDTVVHTVRSDSGYNDPLTGKFASGEVNPGQSYDYTITEEGVYGYHCDIHPWMQGEVRIVENFA